MDRLDKIKEFLKPIAEECDDDMPCSECINRKDCDEYFNTIPRNFLEDLEKLEKHLEGEANDYTSAC